MRTIALGAESVIYRMKIWGIDVVQKVRHKKTYLHPEIDIMLRKTRTSRECKMLNEVRSLGLPTPTVYIVNLKEFSFVMDYIPGQQLKQIIGVCSTDEIKEHFSTFGSFIAIMHRADIVHGDPTTSNFIVDDNNQLWMVDFGLSEKNATLEMKGVDLHLIRRVLETTHWDLQDILLEATLKGYSKVLGSTAQDAISRMDEIRERGRYH